MTRLVVFDLDGTLVDSARQIVSAMRAGYAAVDRVAPDDMAILSIVGLSLPLAVQRLSPGIETADRDKIVVAYRAAFMADSAVPPLYPGVADTLAGIAREPGVLLAIATGKTRRGLVKVLDQHGLRPLFHSLHGGDEHPSKPDPSMLRAAMAAAGVGAEATVMVGDSLFDAQMARTAGVRFLGARWGYYPTSALSEAGAAAILGRFSDLTSALSLVMGDQA